ncbi:uncharacterized protein LOC106176063 [Lingula anatina]|uniref:Uncharacterized protein LOC106176063 n=1 Tax=Lingula anatina TaxID=7574 RepID=A0A1S3JTT0_LINAN|nr:uncharacterized protein LOC106176063 [Lingula anatina]|eukprot:XP_013413733.1 uncharacterized protein LOC106176063 [Lingula anatina]
MARCQRRMVAAVTVLLLACGGLVYAEETTPKPTAEAAGANWGYYRPYPYPFGYQQGYQQYQPIVTVTTASWGPWSDWSDCYCNFQYRMRQCSNPFSVGQSGCTGAGVETRRCVGVGAGTNCPALT